MKSEKVAVVDDFEAARLSLVENLVLDGHKVVISAPSPKEFKGVIDNSKAEFRIAIIDNRMPNEGDGESLARYLRAKHKGVRIISYAADMQTWGDLNFRKGVDLEKLLKSILEMR